MDNRCVRKGAISLDEVLNDIEVPSLDVPELGALLVSDKSKDLFEEKKRKAWKELDHFGVALYVGQGSAIDRFLP